MKTLTLLAAVAVLPWASLRADGPGGDGAGRPAERTAVTKIPMLVLPLGFSDCRLTLSDEDWHLKIFSTPSREEEDRRFDLFGFCGTSVNHYFAEITGGRFQFEPAEETCGAVGDGVVRVVLDEKHPHEDAGAMARAVRLAIAKAAQYSNLMRYDLNADHVLGARELVVLVVAAGGTADNTYSRNRTFYSRLDARGCSIPSFVAVSERRDDLREVYAKLVRGAGRKPEFADFPVSVGTLIHELGHALGTPDLPGTGYLTAVGYGQKNGTPARFPGTALEYGRSTPSHYGAFTMVRAGFVEPVVLRTSGVYEVRSAATGRYNVYKATTADPKEYFLIENRQREGSDLALGAGRHRSTGGLAIWHVDENSRKKDDSVRPPVAIVDAGEGDPARGRPKSPDPFFHRPGNIEFGAASIPGNRSYDGQPQPWAIGDISASGRVMSFRFTLPGGAGR